LVGNATFENVRQVTLIEQSQGFRRYAVGLPFAAGFDCGLQPSLLDPEVNLGLVDMQSDCEAFQRKTVTSDITQAQAMSLQHASNRFRGTLQFPRYFLNRILNQLLADELYLRLGPTTVFNLALEAILDDEPPTCLPRPSGITLQSHYELFELIPG
jgi:hypothetical protein